MPKSGPAYKRLGKNIYEVRGATTANLAALSAPQTVDGVALVAGDLCLVKNQTVPTQNGIYRVQAAAWTREADMIVALGTTARVREGTANRARLFTSQDTTGTSWV
jgi:hypothetical protein